MKTMNRAEDNPRRPEKIPVNNADVVDVAPDAAAAVVFSAVCRLIPSSVSQLVNASSADLSWVAICGA